jgi:hypothetical protein
MDKIARKNWSKISKVMLKKKTGKIPNIEQTDSAAQSKVIL